MVVKLCSIFAAALLVDFLVARYTKAVAQGKALRAASLSAFLAIANLTLLSVVIAWTENCGVLPIATFAGGSWLGTYFTVRRP